MIGSAAWVPPMLLDHRAEPAPWVTSKLMGCGGADPDMAAAVCSMVAGIV